MKIYAFDVDDTLEISRGPVKFNSIMALWKEGHIIGLCGNFAVVTMNVANWHRVFSFIGPASIPGDKAFFLSQLRIYVPADEYIFVGNILGVSGGSDDQGAADRAGWRFIKESDFAEGAR